MRLTENELRALHAEACAAVLSTDRSVTPAEDAFWPLYIQSLLDAHSAHAMLSVAERDVIAERRRHVDVEGWTPEHDDKHAPGTLAMAGSAYAVDAGFALDSFVPDAADRFELVFWPFSSDWWKPGIPRRGLVKAASLILAEIERIDRDPGDQSGHHHSDGGDHA